MKEYPEYVDNTIIKWYESDIISDFKMPIPDENKDDLDKAGCFFDSNVWNETLSEKEVVQTLIFNEICVLYGLLYQKELMNFVFHIYFITF